MRRFCHRRNRILTAVRRCLSAPMPGPCACATRRATRSDRGGGLAGGLTLFDLAARLDPILEGAEIPDVGVNGDRL